MHVAGFLAALLIIAVALIDAFETILQPRRVIHRFRYARFFYRNTWKIWRIAAMQIPEGKKREAFLGIFGPLSLLGLFATWVAALIVGFGLVHWAIGSPVHGTEISSSLLTYLYLSGTTFFTLGFGDVTPTAAIGRTLAVIESGMGFAILAILVSYLPVLYQAFSKRELTISLLDARAGSPPSAVELLARLARSGNTTAIERFLIEWELWAAELLESHLSFPVLSYYRSQHDNQSWLAALTMILDTSALLLVTARTSDTYQAQLTFAMARHAAVDLALVLKARPMLLPQDRCSADHHQQMLARLRQAGMFLGDNPDMHTKMTELRAMYEPFVNTLAQRLMVKLPPIMPGQAGADNWQRSSWMPRTPGIGSLPGGYTDEEHFG